MVLQFFFVCYVVITFFVGVSGHTTLSAVFGKDPI